jgi:hypothetical protein
MTSMAGAKMFQEDGSASETLEAIRAASRQLEEFFARYPSGSLGTHTPVPNLTPLLEALERAGRILQKAPPGPELDTSSKAEVTEYAEKLRRLKRTLEQLQPQLEERRDAIRSRLGRIRAALDWADSFNQTRE